MAHGVGFASLASVDKSPWYSKHARMTVAYRLVLVHCGMTTVAFSLVVTRCRRTESKCCTGGTRNPLGTTDIEGSLPISVACANFGHTYVYGPYSRSSRGKCRKASWGSYAKLRVMKGRVDLSHATGITSLIAAAVLKSVHETLAWITPTPVTWTCWIWQIPKKWALRVCAQTCNTFYPPQRAIPGRHVSHSEHVSLQKERSRVPIPCPTR